MFWCIQATKSVSPEFRYSCKVVFCSSFADQDGWDAEKSWNSVESVFFLSKMLIFHQISQPEVELHGTAALLGLEAFFHFGTEH